VSESHGLPKNDREVRTLKEVFDLTDFNARLMFRVVALDRCRIGPAFVDRDLLGRSMLTECLAQETQRSLTVSLGGQQEVHSGTGLVDGSIQVLPDAPDFHIGLVHSPTATHRTLARVEFLLQEWGLLEDPAIERRVVDLHTALFHHFLKLAVQVPLISGHANARRLIRADLVGQVQAACLEDRKARYQRKPPGMIPVVSENPMGPAVLPTMDSWQWFTETARTRAPAWRNEVTLRSVEMLLEYEPGAHITHISPTPLMMVVALGDHLTVADEALAAYERALEPKRLVTLPGGHFDAYVRDFAASSGAACEWFRKHLLVTESP